MKDTITNNIVGVMPTEEIKQYVPDFNPTDFDIDEVISKILEAGGGTWMIGKVINQFWNTELREKQKSSLRYFLGQNDSKRPGGEIIMITNPFTGYSTPMNDTSKYYSSRVAIPFHSNVVRELASFTAGSGQIEIKLGNKDKDNKNVKKEITKFSKKWNDIDKLIRELAEDYFIYSQAGVRWNIKKVKDFSGKEEFKLESETIEPLNTWGFTLGSITNDINRADCIIVCADVVDGTEIETKFELYTNRAMYVIDYSKTTGEKGKINEAVNYTRVPLWVKGTEEKDLIRPPFSFVNIDRKGKLLIDDYKEMIDAYDSLLNSSTDDSLYFDQKLLVIKGSDYSSDYQNDLISQLKALGKDKVAQQAQEGAGYRAIWIPDGDGSVEAIDNSLPTEHSEMVFKLLNNNMYDAAGIIDYNKDSTNENYNAIKTKYNKVLSKIEPVRSKIKDFVYNSIEMLIIFEKILGSDIADEMIEKYHTMFIEFSNSFLINELDQQNALSTAVGAGFISKQTASEKSSFAADDEYERLIKQSEEQEIKEQENTVPDTQTDEKGGTTTGALRQKTKLKIK